MPFSLLWYLFFLLAHIQKIQAQFPHLYFENITTQNGLSNNSITCLYEDTHGFLWIGTANGLNKYDGNTFQCFYHEEGNANSLSGNSIVQIMQDKTGIFWIATRDGGLTRYDETQIREKQFTQIKNNPSDSTSLPSNRLTALCDYSTDYMIVGGEKMSVGFLNKKTYKLLYYTLPIFDPVATKINFSDMQSVAHSNTWIQHLELDSNNVYISILSPDIIYVINKKENTILSGEIKSETLSIPSFTKDDDTIWLASWNKGIYYQLAPNAQKNKSIIEQKKIPGIDEEVTCFLNYDKNSLLAATINAGVYILNKQTYAFTLLKHDRADINSLASNHVNCMLMDKHNILWVGTASGLSKYNPLLWQFQAEEIDKNYDKEITQFSIYESENATLRICTSNGVYKKEGDTYKHIDYVYENKKLQPTKICGVGNNKYLLNTETNSFWYEPSTETIQLLMPEKYAQTDSPYYYISNPMQRGSYQVRFTETDTIQNNPMYIFGIMGWGIGVYDLLTKTYYDLISDENNKNSIQNNLVRILFKDSEHNYWVGTAEGLYKWKKSYPPENNFEKYVNDENNPTSISGNSITGIYQSPDMHLWITTNNALNEFDGKIFHHYIPAFVKSKTMYGIYADNNNQLWIAVPDGFEIFNIETKNFRYINVPKAEWMLKYPSQIVKTKSGEWIYGAGNNIIKFNPDTYYFDADFPELYLTDFSIFDKSIFNTEAFKHLKFNHNSNFFTITFSSLQLSQPNTVNYQYQIKELANDWIDLDNNGKIVLTGLRPGHFTVYVKVTNALGTWSDSKQLVAFTVAPPYWQQWWFYLLCILTIATVVYIVVKYREKQFIKIQTIRNKIANDLHDDVGSALSTINLYSEVAKIKSQNDEVKNILDKISNTSVEMQENMSHIVWNLQPRNDHFEQMTIKLKSYAIENLQTKNIITEFTCDTHLQSIKLSPEQRKEFFLIYKEVIHNITKYAECTEVKINLQKSKELFVISIADNGKGFDTTKQYSGNGLHTMKERAAALKGEVRIESKENEGTILYLQFPL